MKTYLFTVVMEVAIEEEKYVPRVERAVKRSVEHSSMRVLLNNALHPVMSEGAHVNWLRFEGVQRGAD